MLISQIQDAIHFMEVHILDDIGYVDVAKSVHMSGYSFHRVFSAIVGMTANEYIRCRRLSLAGVELQSTSISVLEAAYKYGYESPESFSKAFSKFHGSTPRQAKAKGAKICLFEPLVIKISIGGGTMINYRIEHKESQKFLAVKRAFSNETSLDQNGHSIPEFWTECGGQGGQNLIDPMKALCAPGKADIFGLCAPLKESETEFYYGIGVRVDEYVNQADVDRLLSDGRYSMWTTQPADYAVFPCVGPDGECLGEAWDKFFKEFCPQTGYTQTDDTDYEIYFEKGEPGVFCELWVPVVKSC